MREHNSFVSPLPNCTLYQRIRIIIKHNFSVSYDRNKEHYRIIKNRLKPNQL